MAEKVIWTSAAREDLRNIAAYIATDRPDLAEPYCLGLIEAGDSVGDFSQLGRMVPELQNANVREIIRPPYRIMYELFADQPRPVIMRVWHSARGTPELIRPPIL